MIVHGFVQTFVLGSLGGALVELLRWWKLREAEAFPIYAKSRRYWLITLLMIMAGGLVATLYGTDNRNALMVVNLGAAAPALISAFASKRRQERKSDSRHRRRVIQEQGLEGHMGSLRSFLTFGA